MAYPLISKRRMPYDIDGTSIAYNTTGLKIPTNWANSSQMVEANNELTTNAISGGKEYLELFIFFPERREIEALFMAISGQYTGSLVSIQGSNDSSNGQDGTWETASLPDGSPLRYAPASYEWRSGIKSISFSESKRCLRILIRGTNSVTYPIITILHIYGRKASGEILDDVIFCNVSNAELTELIEWGDRPEGTTMIKSFKVKNVSSTKIANNVNLQLNHADFLMSLDQVNWVATIDISSIPPNSLSAEIFIKNPLGAPPLTLGPKAARIIATVGSFT